MRVALPASLVVLMLPIRVHAGSVEIMHGSVAVREAAYEAYKFEVPASAVTDARVEGQLEASGGSGNDIEVFVLSQTQFVNWQNNHSTPTLYNSGRATALDVYAPIVKPGTYHVVFFNGFSTFTPKTVAGDLRLKWTDARVAEDTSPGAPDSEALTTSDVVAFTSLMGLVGGAGVLIGRRVGRRKSV